MTTLGDLTTEIRRDALSGLREESNQLGTSMATAAAGATSTFNLAAGQTLGSIQPGSIVEIDDEQIFITSAPAATTVMGLRGYNGSLIQSHAASALMRVNPRFTSAAIKDAINAELDSLSSPANGLFQMLEVTLTFIPVRQGYDMTGVNPQNVIEIWEVRAHEYGPAEKWPIIPPSMWKWQRNADTATFPSGMALTLDLGGYPGRPLRVQYKAPYTTPLVNSADDVQAVTGLHSQANDILTLGGTVRIMEFRELKRSFPEAQGEPRRAQEVPVGSSLTALKGLMARREARIAEERARLRAMYPRQQR